MGLIQTKCLVALRVIALPILVLVSVVATSLSPLMSQAAFAAKPADTAKQSDDDVVRAWACVGLTSGAMDDGLKSAGTDSNTITRKAIVYAAYYMADMVKLPTAEQERWITAGKSVKGTKNADQMALTCVMQASEIFGALGQSLDNAKPLPKTTDTQMRLNAEHLAGCAGLVTEGTGTPAENIVGQTQILMRESVIMSAKWLTYQLGMDRKEREDRVAKGRNAVDSAHNVALLKACYALTSATFDLMSNQLKAGNTFAEVN